MCGCAMTDEWSVDHKHEDHCACSCHRGIQNYDERCHTRLDEDEEDYLRCSLRAGHDGMHKGYGIGWPAAVCEWWSSDDTPRPLKVQDLPGSFLDHFGIKAHGHPGYYGGKDDPYEAIKVIHAWGLNFDLGSVLKYVRRAGKKEDQSALVDLRKARSYIDFAIEEEMKKADQ